MIYIANINGNSNNANSFTTYSIRYLENVGLGYLSYRHPIEAKFKAIKV